ncbi:MAG: hypothetical protein Ct9H300mP21_00250 [Pseudomonadota bacterium]|nr:MAG: hypothetical protein Ct9H300mP21_00250 [Pseudomonadota bacterium]
MSDPQHKLVPFFHLPLQPGNNTILQKMKRRYSSENIQKKYGGLSKGTGLVHRYRCMVGFPEESETEFKSTLNYLKNCL